MTTYVRTDDYRHDDRKPPQLDPDRYCGAQWDVAAHVPGVFRAMNPLNRGAVLPVVPRPLVVGSSTRGYWFPLFALMLTSLGWVRPDAGMNWWYRAGTPTDDPRLGLIHDVWHADGGLTDLTCQMWNDQGFWEFTRNNDTDFLTSLGYREDRTVDRGVIAPALAELLARTPPRGGSTQLHTAHMLAYHTADSGNARLINADPRTARATLLTDSMRGWYGALVRLGSQLDAPRIGGRMSWHVDVVVEHIGSLGTYRRSTETGLWFAGPHSLHTKGA